MLSPEYVAGLFDGEGCASITHGSLRYVLNKHGRDIKGFKARIIISNTHRPVLEMLQTQFAGCLNLSSRTKNNPIHQEVWSWILSGADKQRVFLRQIEPFCVIKKRQVFLFLEYLETAIKPWQEISPESREIRLRIAREMKLLNGRGVRGRPPKLTPERAIFYDLSV